MKSFVSLTVFVLLILVLPHAGRCQSERVVPIKVGLILPLTGPLAEYGHAFQNGIALARQEHPSVDRNCAFVTEDSRYDPKSAVASFQKLASSGINIVYNWGGAPSDALAPLADRHDVALFVWSADPGVAEGRKLVVRFANSGADYGQVLADYLIQKGYKSVGIVKTENQYIEAILNGFKGAAAGRLMISDVDSFQPNELEFRQSITKLKARSYDALGVFLISGQVAHFVKQAKAQHLAAPLFGTDFFESMTEVEQSHGGMVGAVFANNEVRAVFAEKYRSTYGNDLQINHAANGYDFAEFLCEKLAPRLNDRSATGVVQATRMSTEFEGQQGAAVFTTSPGGDKYFKFPVVMREVTAERIVSVGK